ASSSCEIGAPKSPTTASPMNFSTVPPRTSISSLSRWWYGRKRARTSSGSAASEAAVKPTRSANRTDTTLRSSPFAGAAASGLPQFRQKRALAGLSCEQFEQTGIPASLTCAPTPRNRRLEGRFLGLARAPRAKVYVFGRPGGTPCTAERSLRIGLRNKG